VQWSGEAIVLTQRLASSATPNPDIANREEQSMATLQRITPCLWFTDQAEEAARFYTGIFPNSKIGRIARYPTAGQETHKRPPGSVMTVEFELDGNPFTGLNGGPVFRFNEAVSFQVACETQAEIDHYWNRLSAGGDPSAQVCGWLKDRFGLSWQIVPRKLAEMMADPDRDRAGRVMTALLEMKKLDLDELNRAYRGSPAGATA
jgi:predicted 3-demethylubiquinone-9 3-methyltransferase (glyoxalase superfamily)